MMTGLSLSPCGGLSLDVSQEISNSLTNDDDPYLVPSQDDTESDICQTQDHSKPHDKSHMRSTLDRFEPNWDSLDKRKLPEWFDDAKVGIFLHWGVFSVPSFSSEWFWHHWRESKSPDVVKFIQDNYPPGFTYQEFAPLFRAELFDADKWAQVFADSGAKYVVLTSKHHEGYTLWPSNTAFSWNSVEVGPKRDLVGLVGDAVRKRGLTFGVYHSLFEWFNPLWLKDHANNFTTDDFVKFKTLPELYDLVNRYKPEIIWSDGEWDAPESYWKSLDFLAWLYNDSPVKDTVVVNDRWGKGTGCKHGDYFNCADRYRPGKLQAKKWEDAMTLDKNSWGYSRRSTFKDYYTIRELILEMAQTVAYGGNILINVGPTADGRIEPIYEERLLQLGSWLKVNGEAVYKTSPWKIAQNDSLTKDVYYTSSKDGKIVYAILMDWPEGDLLRLGSIKTDKLPSGVTVTLVKNNQGLSYETSDKEFQVSLASVPRAVSNDVAFVLKIQGL